MNNDPQRMQTSARRYPPEYYERQKRRQAAIRRKKIQRRRFFACAIGLLIVLILAIVLIVKGCSDKKDNSANAVLNGTFIYNQYTEYEFDGKDRGCMCLEGNHFEFTYIIDGDQLSLDFDNAAAHDCSYTFTLDGNALTIVGGEGTTGGTYKLTKQ